MAESISNIDVSQWANIRELLHSAMEMVLSNWEISKAEIQALKTKFATEIASIDSWLEVNKKKVSQDAQEELKNLKLVTSHRQMENTVPVTLPEKKSDTEKTSQEMVNKYDLSKSDAIEDANLKGQTAEVNVKWKLHMRDKDGKVVWLLEAGKEVKLTGKAKISDNLRFVEVEGGNYVAEKYLNMKSSAEAPKKEEAKSKGDDKEKDTNKKAAKKIEKPKKSIPEVIQKQGNLDYTSLQNSIKEYNKNEKKFLFPEGSSYFWDNFSSDAQSGFAIKRGKEDFRIIVANDGTFTTLNTTGVEYVDIKEKAKKIKTGKITMKADQFDFSAVL